ncbi:histone-fold-containing protein [Dacryopinax primogenitus]|uniref:DNA polymerase epsilon subunit D n=1 Tax=Dacryopinax primogenitus (strain DJM 731) TaxID=1858805 RepID=M5G325_DACPD|nr:histone-fold-containing protein [Dacryopinax primogenitus]EJT98157.1 histone-fold-containing protein [Dacryopinax primogenitus]
MARADSPDAEDTHKQQEQHSIQDFELPKTLVTRIAKAALPDNIKLQKEAVTALVMSTTVFINYLAATAQDVTWSRSAKTITAQDVLKALEIIEFDDQVEPMKRELEGVSSSFFLLCNAKYGVVWKTVQDPKGKSKKRGAGEEEQKGKRKKAAEAVEEKGEEEEEEADEEEHEEEPEENEEVDELDGEGDELIIEGNALGGELGAGGQPGEDEEMEEHEPPEDVSMDVDVRGSQKDGEED